MWLEEKTWPEPQSSRGRSLREFREELISIAPSYIIHEMPFGSTAQSLLNLEEAFISFFLSFFLSFFISLSFFSQKIQYSPLLKDISLWMEQAWPQSSFFFFNHVYILWLLSVHVLSLKHGSSSSNHTDVTSYVVIKLYTCQDNKSANILSFRFF